MIRRLFKFLWSPSDEVPDGQKEEVRSILEEAQKEVTESRSARQRALEFEYQLSARRRRR